MSSIDNSPRSAISVDDTVRHARAIVARFATIDDAPATERIVLALADNDAPGAFRDADHVVEAFASESDDPDDIGVDHLQEFLDAIIRELDREFIDAFAYITNLNRDQAHDQWNGFSRQLPDRECRILTSGGWDAGICAGGSFNAMFGNR